MAQSVTEFLKSKVAILSTLTDEELNYIASTVETRAVKATHIVFFKGEALPGLHVVQTGGVEVWAKNPTAKDAAKLAELGPGAFFGEASILEESVAGATVKAGADGAQLLIIPQETFLQLMQARPELREQLTALIESRKTHKPARPAQ